MKIVQINTFSNGSTGKIMMDIHKELLDNNHDSYVIWGRGRKSNNSHEIFLNNKVGVYKHVILSRITGKVGFYSRKSTKKLLKKLDEIKPDIIHLHNIHGYYINIEMLIKYIKNKNIPLVWTLHDCWPFTGHCAYFDIVKCHKWQKECTKCPQLYVYPKSFFDNTKWNYNKKKELFSNLNLTLITPSIWLKKLVQKSYLKKYTTYVINNGINQDIFKPTKSEFRKKYNLENKIIILGVANVWEPRKGLNDFIKLSKILDDNYQIVLIGLNKKQQKKLPKNIIGLNKTKTQKELVEIYSTADTLFNPTYEDNYPTVNLEALSCGTPVITYNTGGSPESINNYNGMIIDNNVSKINKDIFKKSNYQVVKNVNYAKEKMAYKYIKTYESIIKQSERKTHE